MPLLDHSPTNPNNPGCYGNEIGCYLVLPQKVHYNYNFLNQLCGWSARHHGKNGMIEPYPITHTQD